MNVLDLALELEPALRGAYLETIGRGDSDLKQQVVAHLRLFGNADPEPDEATTAEARLVNLDLPQRVGPYRILHELGRGGMSRVYLAERADDEFKRQVALKVIDHDLEAPIAHQRFLAERQILASFDCPQIAKLFDGGTLPNGRPYFVMELVDGVRADQFCAEHRLAVAERLQLFRKICSAVSYAHQNLVVHRDLKPSNILVTPDREPKLLDFGIAKLLDPDSFPLDLCEMTRSQQRPMTPTCASPEQLLGENITTATDVYALGVLLFQLLTGAVPYQPQNRLQLVLREREGVAEPPRLSDSMATAAAEHTWEGQDLRRLKRVLQGDLDNIVSKALRPLAADRYASVVELDEDVRRYLEGEPVRATRETPLYLIGKFLRRYRLPAALVATMLVLVSTFALIAQRQAHNIARERDRANEIRRYFADFIESANLQARQPSSAGLRDLLDQNLEQLQKQPFQDTQTQLELLELVADGYRSLSQAQKAFDIYDLALAVPNLSEIESLRLLSKQSDVAELSGRTDLASRVLSQNLGSPSTREVHAHVSALTDRSRAQMTEGNLLNAVLTLRGALALYGNESLDLDLRQVSTSLSRRLDLTSNLSADREPIELALADFLRAIGQPGSADYVDLMQVAVTYETLGNYPESLTVQRYLYQKAFSEGKFGPSWDMVAEHLSETLYGSSRFEEALKMNSKSLRLAEERLQQKPSPRASYELGSFQARQGAILKALGRHSEAAIALEAATQILEPLARDTPIIFVKIAQARAYLAAGRRDQSRSLVKVLVETGWRRADLMSLALAQDSLPDPMPAPLELRLDLPPRLRKYLDALPRQPLPWQAGNLPTVEEILVAEEKRVFGESDENKP